MSAPQHVKQNVDAQVTLGLRRPSSAAGLLSCYTPQGGAFFDLIPFEE